MYEQLKSSLDIKNVMSFYGVKFSTNVKAICPIHNDKHASMVVYTNKQIFSCLTCGAGGDIINFVAALFGIKNSDAAKKLKLDFKLNLDRPLTKSEKIKFARMKKEANKKRREKEKLDELYWHLWEEYAHYDKICDQNKPERYKTVNDLWIFANEQRELLWDKLLGGVWE